VTVRFGKVQLQIRTTCSFLISWWDKKTTWKSEWRCRVAWGMSTMLLAPVHPANLFLYA
jgi:uncharacterized membrane protein YsdA (DUF1294 family)